MRRPETLRAAAAWVLVIRFFMSKLSELIGQTRRAFEIKVSVNIRLPAPRPTPRQLHGLILTAQLQEFGSRKP